MSVSGVSSNTTSTSSSASLAGSSSAQDIQSQFMTLLIKQLQNQDPLNPMDNSAITSQMAQISTVNGIQQLNSTMTSLAQSLTGSQASQAVSLIGKEVAVPGTGLALSSSGGSAQAVGSFWLDSGADSATVKIQDSKGNTVRTLQMSNLNAGLQNFSWDGLSDSGVTEPDGNYQISVSAAQNGQTVSVQPLQWGMVGSVQQDATSGWNVLLSGSSTPVALSSVKSVVGS